MSGQLSLADGVAGGGAGRNRQLKKIAAVVDCAAVERLLGEVYAAVARPASLPEFLTSGTLRSACAGPWRRVADEVRFGARETQTNPSSRPASTI